MSTLQEGYMHTRIAMYMVMTAKTYRLFCADLHHTACLLYRDWLSCCCRQYQHAVVLHSMTTVYYFRREDELYLR